MNVRHHAMPQPEFTALARGDGGPAAISRLVAAQHSKHMILLRAVAEQAKHHPGPVSRIAAAGYELLARVQRADQAAAVAVIGYPSVGAWALYTLRDDRSVPGARPDGLAAVAAAAAVRAGVATEIEVPVHGGRVLLPSLGAADAAGTTAIIRTGAGEVLSAQQCVMMRPGAPGWRDVRTAQAGALHVFVDDLDPFRMTAPDGTPAGRLTPAEVTELAASLDAAQGVLSPARAAEIAAIVRVIVPFTAPPSGHVSTSSPQSFGTVAMSRQPDRHTCAETLVHETQHLKLCALLDLVSLTVPDNGLRYYAPWRTDPRPASGLLQGAYAFLGVSGFWREQRQAATDPAVRRRAHIQFARWRDGAALAVGTLLGSGQLTQAGQEFAGSMAGVLAAWRGEAVPADALMIARRTAGRHLARWHADNGPRAAQAARPDQIGGGSKSALNRQASAAPISSGRSKPWVDA
jgi:HEXXH motif-containing protein